MNEYQKEMIKLFRQLGTKHAIYEVFFDFTRIAAYSISNSFDKIHFEERERDYHRIIKKYDEKDVALFPKLFALLVEAMDKKPGDVLGEIYMELEISNKQAGQFFTPYHVAELMAEISFSVPEKEIEEKGFTTVYEPCVGGGVTLIALLHVMQANGYNYQTQLRVYCGDIDSNVLSMCYVQLSLLGVDAICERRNALLNEEASEVWFTPFYAINRNLEAEKEKSVKSLEKMKQVIDMLKALETPVLEHPEQLSLF